MSDTEERKKRPANDNPWYCLATLYGEWNGDKDLHAKNRIAWNRGFASALTDDQYGALIAHGFAPEELEPLNDAEKTELVIAFGRRYSGNEKVRDEQCLLELLDILLTDINFTYTHFEKEAQFEGFLFANTVHFDDVTFAAGAHFECAMFLKKVHFDTAAFSRSAWFGGVAFSENAYFRWAQFAGHASFNDAKFSGEARFDDTTFSYAWFERSQFRNRIQFLNAEFKNMTAFSSASFTRDVPDFRGATLHEATEWHDVKWPAAARQKKDAHAQVYAYERLKQEMEGLKKHEDEQMFFRKELRARRGTMPFFSWDRLLNFTYEGLSDYGQSTRLPFFWLLVMFAFGTLLLAETPATPDASTVMGLQRAASLNYAYIFSIFPFHSAITVGQKFSDLSGLGQTIFLVETLFGTLLLFLIGLALRNKFRMR